MKIKLIIICAFFVIFIPSSAFAGTYYVSYGASGYWSSATNRNMPCSYKTANENAVAGDTVIFLDDGGVFNIDGYGINPSNNGTIDQPITFRGEDEANVIIRASHWGAKLIGRSYITLENLTFQNGGGNSWISMRNSDSGTTSAHIIIRNCTFEATNSTWAGIYGSGNIHHIYIQNNIIKGGIATGSAQGDAIYIVPTTGHSARYLLIEGNDLEGASHVTLDFQTFGGTIEYAIIRNNEIHNPNHSSINIYGSAGTRPQYILFENNRVFDAGSICGLYNCPENLGGSTEDKSRSREQHANLQWSANYGIVRNNIFYNGGRGFDVQNIAQSNRIYNNVFANNVQGAYFNTGGIVTGNKFVNNIFVDNNLDGTVMNYPVGVHSLTSSPCENYWSYNNFDDINNVKYKACNGTPLNSSLSWLEVNLPDQWNENMETKSMFEDKVGHDYRLKTNSPLVDSGAWLTMTSGSGNNSNVLVVHDARYFMDGWGIIEGDIIQLEGQKTPIKIKSINYSTNTITVDRNISWTNNQGISLAYKGSAPDVGAFELAISAPTNLRIIQ